jgi:hypothetical protein
MVLIMDQLIVKTLIEFNCEGIFLPEVLKVGKSQHFSSKLSEGEVVFGCSRCCESAVV